MILALEILACWTALSVFVFVVVPLLVRLIWGREPKERRHFPFTKPASALAAHSSARPSEPSRSQDFRTLKRDLFSLSVTAGTGRDEKLRKRLL